MANISLPMASFGWPAHLLSSSDEHHCWPTQASHISVRFILVHFLSGFTGNHVNSTQYCSSYFSAVLEETTETSLDEIDPSHLRVVALPPRQSFKHCHRLSVLIIKIAFICTNNSVLYLPNRCTEQARKWQDKLPCFVPYVCVLSIP